MIKALPLALTTGIIAAGFVSTTAVTEVSAASSYKLVNNKLVHSKTGKAVKNHAIYKKKLYKNGKLVTKTTVYKKFLFKKGKLVTKSTVHNKQLFQKGKLVTKTTVYNKQLFHKGKLATGNDLHNKTLYVNGKISSGIVKHNKQLYKAGKKVASNFKFIYKGKVYKGNKVDKNFKFVEGYLEYKGEHYFGTIDKTYFEYGVDYSDTISNSTFYSNTGKSMTAEIHLYSEGKLKYNKNDISVNNGATITNVKFIKATGYRSPKIVISLSKTKMNTNYVITVQNATVGKSKPFIFKEQFSGLTSKTLASKDYKKLKQFYDKYHNFTAKEASKVNIDNMYFIVMDVIQRIERSEESYTAVTFAEYSLAIYLFDKFGMTPEF